MDVDKSKRQTGKDANDYSHFDFAISKRRTLERMHDPRIKDRVTSRCDWGQIATLGGQQFFLLQQLDA
jgi:hypothetical protein